MQPCVTRLLVRQLLSLLRLLLPPALPPALPLSRLEQEDHLALLPRCLGRMLALQRCLRHMTCSAQTSNCQPIGVRAELDFGRTRPPRMHACTWQQFHCGHGNNL